ncbi:MAG: hypothetical protein NTW50_02755 [Candidatus Berkelbacteria bacterium]|nr:hypothetical protein [Candidatus Berkelbacteria bacterium]
MEMVSVSAALKKRKNGRVLAVLACLVLSFILFQIIVTGGGGKSKAAPGDSADNPYIISGDGFFYVVGGNQINFCLASGAQMTIQNGSSSITGICSGSGKDLANDYVEIRSGMIVGWGSLAFRGLTLKSGVTLTHAPIVYHSDPQVAATIHTDVPGYIESANSQEQDYHPTTGALNGVGSTKKVDITTTDFLRIEDGAIIDVSGRGFPGGDVPTSGAVKSGGNGFGSGFVGGQGITGSQTCSGFGWAGGGSGASSVSTTSGLGGSGRNVTNSGGCTLVYNYLAASTSANSSSYGGGGGNACWDDGSGCVAGGAGGGYINLNSSQITIFSKAKIYANGLDGSGHDVVTQTAKLVSGAGGGGKINITASANLIALSENTVDPTVKAGSVETVKAPGETVTYPGSDGVLVSNATLKLGDNIRANGGNDGLSHWSGVAVGAGGASGGGGYININAVAIQPLCEISANSGIDHIPAACENKDVSINGNSQDLASLWQSGDSVQKVYSDLARVWKTMPLEADNSHYECKNQVMDGGSTYLWNGVSVSAGVTKCNYIKSGGSESIILDAQKVTNVAGSDCTVATVSGYEVVHPSLVWSGLTIPPVSQTVRASRYPACDSKRNFASLSISNNGILTHSALSVSDMTEDSADLGGQINGSLSDNTAGQARWKKVDLATTNDLSIQTGGRIDVSGQGYLGSFVSGSGPGLLGALNGYTDGSGNVFGWGPAGGQSTFRDSAAGGGGGFAGSGAKSPGKTLGGAKITLSNTQIEWGSGGGAGVQIGASSMPSVWDGGSGGGAILLKVLGRLTLGASSSIRADGRAAAVISSGGDTGGAGGGSGGLVNIKYNNASFPDGLDPLLLNGGINGGNGTAQIDLFLPNLIESLGGNGVASGSASQNGGGGGYVFARKVNLDSVPSVSKTLVPLNRSGVGGGFDPYSLEVGDEIQVTLKFTNILTTMTLQDDWLSEGANACVPEEISVKPAPDGYDNDDSAHSYTNPLTWSYISGPTFDVTYNCKVK